MSVHYGVSPSGTPVARVHAEILDEKPSSCVAFVFALSLHPRQTSQIVLVELVLTSIGQIS